MRRRAARVGARAQAKLRKTEAHTQSELTRLQEENATHLARLAEYEMAKALSAEAAQAADEALAKRGREGAAPELQRAKDTQAESMRMAMALQKTFDALVPYFVYRSVLEGELEERRQGVGTCQAEVKASRRAYNRSMDYLEELSLEIQTKEKEDKEAKAREEAAAAGGGGDAPADEDDDVGAVAPSGRGAAVDVSDAADGGVADDSPPPRPQPPIAGASSSARLMDHGVRAETRGRGRGMPPSRQLDMD